MEERVAIIDLGTNTFNLLIVERFDSRFDIIFSERKGVGLGHGGINNSIISPSAFKRGIQCLKQYKNECDKHSVSSIFAFGTSALRHSKNRHLFIEEVQKECGFTIQILSGNEEAKLIYKGIHLGYDFKIKSVIMDIGGGSTEFILADSSGILNLKSLEIGVSRINQLFHFESTYTQKNINEVIHYLDQMVGDSLDEFKCQVMVGSSGSFETFYELFHKQNYPSNQFVHLSAGDLLPILDQIIHSDLSERKQNPYIIPIRQEMIPLAAIKTKWVIEKLGVKHIVISPFSLKEGAIFTAV